MQKGESLKILSNLAIRRNENVYFAEVFSVKSQFS